jgi:hypothetical protein
MTTPLNFGEAVLVDEIGAKYSYQGQTTIHGVLYAFTNYKVITGDDLGVELKQLRIEDAAGRLDAIHTNQRLLAWGGTLNCLAGADPKADFPEGKLATLAGLTNWLVIDAKVAKNEDVSKLTLKLLKVISGGDRATEGGMASATT